MLRFLTRMIFQYFHKFHCFYFSMGQMMGQNAYLSRFGEKRKVRNERCYGLFWCDWTTKKIFRQIDGWCWTYGIKSNVCPNGQVILLVSLAVMFLLRKSGVMCSTHARRHITWRSQTSRTKCASRSDRNTSFKKVPFVGRQKRLFCCERTTKQYILKVKTTKRYRFYS